MSKDGRGGVRDGGRKGGREEGGRDGGGKEGGSNSYGTKYCLLTARGILRFKNGSASRS